MQRAYFHTIKLRLSEPRRFIQVLHGPRQVGKTTLIKQALESQTTPYLLETADDLTGNGGTWLRSAWDKARLACRQQGGEDFLLVVDEIQKVENWSETVKREWDADTLNGLPLKVVLLGSSSLLIQKGLTESLAGRFELIPIPHWSYGEMREAFGWNLEQYIWFGGYPGSASLVDNETRWKRYVKESLVETSLSRDILMLSRVDKPALLRRLFELGCLYSAQILSLTKIQGKLMEKGNLTTLSNYLSLLEAAGLLCGIEKFAGDIIRIRSSKPKFQVFNNALLSAQNEKLFPEAKADTKFWGRLCESAVGTHLLNRSRVEDYKLYYWNENSQEVDYVLQKGSRIVAVEVKSGKDSTNKGMEIFDRKFHPTALYTVGTGGISLEEFLSLSPSELF